MVFGIVSHLFIFNLFKLFALGLTSEHSDSNAPWIRINVSTIRFDRLKVFDDGERRLLCGNIDHHFDGKYHWRFNGSSILPDKIKVQRNQLILPRGSERSVDSYTGTYECCVRESLGNACYATIITHKPRDHRVISVMEGDRVRVSLNESLLLRLGLHKNADHFSCTIDGNTVEYLVFASSPQKNRRQLQVRIDKMDRDLFGNYQCFIHHKGKKMKISDFDLISLASKDSIFTILFIVFYINLIE